MSVDVARSMKDAEAKLLLRKNAVLQQFLIENGADPDRQELAHYYQDGMYVLLPKGERPPIEEALQYPHIQYPLLKHHQRR